MKRMVCWGLWVTLLGLGPLTWAQVSVQADPSWDDVWITSRFNYGSDYGVNNEKLQAGGWADYYYFLIKPELAGLPVQATQATFWLYCLDRGDSSTSVGLDLYQVTSGWDENTGWYSQPTATLLSAGLSAPTEGQWYAVDITNWYNQAQSGTVVNYGLEFRPLGNVNQFSVFASSDYANATLRPRLGVTYEPVDQPFTLSFPLPDLTPYTARVTAVFDNDRTIGIVEAYDGEVGSVAPYPICWDVRGGAEVYLWISEGGWW